MVCFVFMSLSSSGPKFVTMLPKSSVWMTSPVSVPLLCVIWEKVVVVILLTLGPNSDGGVPFVR